MESFFVDKSIENTLDKIIEKYKLGNCKNESAILVLSRSALGEVRDNKIEAIFRRAPASIGEKDLDEMKADLSRTFTAFLEDKLWDGLVTEMAKIVKENNRNYHHQLFTIVDIATGSEFDTVSEA